jgi:glutamate synthase domain-containing protein 1
MFLAKTWLSQVFEGKSDSASMDMVIELLLMTGRSPSHDDGGLTEEAGKRKPHRKIKAFTDHNLLWNHGMVSIDSFTGGNMVDPTRYVGLRPSRYTLTNFMSCPQELECGYQTRRCELTWSIRTWKMFLWI